MEIQECSLPGFYCSRILGLAPYTIQKSKSKDRSDEIRRSTWLSAYSIFIMIATVALTVRFIFVDTQSKTPIRMRSATSKFVTVFDVFVVVGACTCGGVTGLIGKRYIEQINMNLKKADIELAIFNEQRKDKRRNLIMVILVFLIMTGMIAMDVISRYRSFEKYKEKQAKDDKPTEDIHFETYFPFYVEYYILMALHVQFAQTALGIQRRYYRLNLAIRNIFSLKKLIETASNIKKNRATKESMEQMNELTADTKCHDTISHGSNVNMSHLSTKSIVKISTISHATEENHTVAAPQFGTGKHSSASPPTIVFGKLGSAAAITKASFFLDRLSYTHAILGETVTLVSKSFGFTLLIMLASCLLHLVATSYFLFIELLGDPDMFVASLQLLWCFFHLSRLLLIVEPCHMATIEARKTIIIVCEVLRNCRDNSIEPVLQQFWRQLLADRTYYFTACGLCEIDRQILTSLSATLATYLVILIQFQKTDG